MKHAQHVIYILNRRGHQAVAKWSPSEKLEIKTAEEMFGTLQEQGYHMYDVSDPRTTGKELTTFDPHATEILGFTQLEGG